MNDTPEELPPSHWYLGFLTGFAPPVRARYFELFLELAENLLTLPPDPQGGLPTHDVGRLHHWIANNLQPGEPETSGALVVFCALTDIIVARLVGTPGPEGHPAIAEESVRSQPELEAERFAAVAARWAELRAGKLSPQVIYGWMMDELGAHFR